METDLTHQDTPLAVAPTDHPLANFFLPDSVGEALRQANWTVLEEVKTLTEMIRDNDVVSTRQGDMKPVVSPREKMVAMQMIRKLAKESLVTSGSIESVKGHAEKFLPDGTRVTLDAESLRMAQEGSRRVMTSLALLEGNTGPETIEVEVLSDNRSGRKPAAGGSLVGDAGCQRTSDGTTVHVSERIDQPPTPSQAKDNDAGTIRGAEDERSTRVSQQSGRSSEGQESGKPDDKPTEYDSHLGGKVYAPAESTPAAPDLGRHPFVPGPRVRPSNPTGGTLDTLSKAFGNTQQRPDRTGGPKQVCSADPAVGPNECLPEDLTSDELGLGK